jgi:hypothetical protein
VQFRSQEKTTVFVESLPINHTAGDRLEATRYPDMVNPESTTMAIGEGNCEPMSQRKDNDANNGNIEHVQFQSQEKATYASFDVSL